MNENRHRFVGAKGSPLTALEYQAGEGEALAYARFTSIDALEQLIANLKEHADKFSVLATPQVDGAFGILIKTKASESETLNLFNEFDPKSAERHKPTDPWVIRSLLGFAGQTLQLTSAYLRPSGSVDTATKAFALSNLAANTINLVYRGQEADDPHQLIHLKQQINQLLTPSLDGKNAQLPDVLQSQITEDSPNKPKVPADDFLRRHSVRIGEIGLRYFGAFALAYPPKLWNKDFFSKGGKPFTRNPSDFRAFAGLSSIAGKTISLTSTIPDPFNPKPASWLDKIREKFTFITGGWVEVVAYSAFAWDCLMHTNPNNPKQAIHGIKIGGKTYRDYLGAIGGAMFVLGYVVRSWAPFGKRQVNLPELYEHIGAGLGQVEPKRLVESSAQLAQSLALHFEKDKYHPHDFIEIYRSVEQAYARRGKVADTNEPAAVLPSQAAENLPPKGPLSKVQEVRHLEPVQSALASVTAA